MKIINSVSGKVGSYFVGPKCYLNENIRLGEVAICIGKEDRTNGKPMIWLLGGIELVIDYVSLARSEGTMEESDAVMLLKRLDDAKTDVPSTAMARLASIASIDVEELMELAKVAQVCISAPVEGVQNFAGSKPTWLPRTLSHASIH